MTAKLSSDAHPEPVYASFDEEDGFDLISRVEDALDKHRSHIVSLEYVSEGGANVVYRITPTHYTAIATSPVSMNGFYRGRSNSVFYRERADSELDHPPTNAIFRARADSEINALPLRLRGKVLRIRKDREPVTQEDGKAPAYVSTAEVQRYFHEEILPRLGEQHVLHHDMVDINSDLIEACNESLAEADEAGSRPKRRRHDRLNESEPHALLLDDMGPRFDQAKLEIKPKWLSDSPNPLGMRRRRCRTCALRAKRNSEKSLKRSNPASGTFCPLALSFQGSHLRQSLENILMASGVKENPEWEKRSDIFMSLLEKDFTSGAVAAVLGKLKTLEEELDSYGCLDIPEDSDPKTLERDRKKFELAMTLRDCTIFMRFGRSGTGRVEVKLADLDHKDWNTRIERWREIEQDLRDGGWYEGTEPQTTTSTQEDVCMLWHTPQDKRTAWEGPNPKCLSTARTRLRHNTC